MVLRLSFGHTLYRNYSDSDFNFVSKSVSDFNSESESESESDSKLADNFFYPFS